MPITDDQVAVLRAYLADDLDEYKQRYARLDDPEARNGYALLLAAAFFKAVNRRFADHGTLADVIEFVASVRTRSIALAESVDPRSAERLICAALTDEDVSDLDDRVKGGLYVVVLAALIGEEGYSVTGLDEFLAEARKIAERWASLS